MNESIRELSLEQIEKGVVSETKRYRSGQPTSPEYALELLRRAIPSGNAEEMNYDEAAFEVLVRLYTPFIYANVNRSAIKLDAIDEITQQVWFKFWMAANRGLSFSTLESFLAYLRTITISVVIQYRRTLNKQYRTEVLTEETMIADEKQDPFDQYIRLRFGSRIKEVITDPLEYQIFSLRYGAGFPPRDIAAKLSREGKSLTARRVSDILEKIFRRLGEDKEIRDLLGADNTFEVVLEGNVNTFGEKEKQNVIQTLSKLLELDPNEVKIVKVSSGSIKITIELPDDAAVAARLFALFLSNDPDLLALRIKSIMELSSEVSAVNQQEIKNSMGLPNGFSENLSMAKDDKGLYNEFDTVLSDKEEVEQEISHQMMIIKEKRRRFRILELQSAKKGSETDPVIIIEMQDIQMQIEEGRQKLISLKKHLSKIRPE